MPGGPEILEKSTCLSLPLNQHSHTVCTAQMSLLEDVFFDIPDNELCFVFRSRTEASKWEGGGCNINSAEPNIVRIKIPPTAKHLRLSEYAFIVCFDEESEARTWCKGVVIAQLHQYAAQKRGSDNETGVNRQRCSQHLAQHFEVYISPQMDVAKSKSKHRTQAQEPSNPAENGDPSATPVVKSRGTTKSGNDDPKNKPNKRKKASSAKKEMKKHTTSNAEEHGGMISFMKRKAKGVGKKDS